MSGLSPDLMLHAYANGIFPMADGADTDEVFWVDPDMRGTIPLDQFHISRSLRRHLRTSGITATVNHDFAGIVRHCADRDETWINADLFETYNALHTAGFAHSVEVWENGTLAGGVFGLTLGGAFFGESMFSARTNGSKSALAFAVDRLRHHGFTLFDTQFITDHLASLGGVEVPRAQYHSMLASALAVEPKPFSEGALATADQVLQRNTQIS